MYQYLVYNGVRPSQLLLEEHSVSTVENLAYSKIIIDSHREVIRHQREERNRLTFQREPKGGYLIAADKPLDVGVLTSNFHVYRACMIAKKWGFENVYGISAQSDPVLFIHLCVRECASIIATNNRTCKGCKKTSVCKAHICFLGPVTSKPSA